MLLLVNAIKTRQLNDIVKVTLHQEFISSNLQHMRIFEAHSNNLLRSLCQSSYKFLISKLYCKAKQKQHFWGKMKISDSPGKDMTTQTNLVLRFLVRLLYYRHGAYSNLWAGFVIITATFIFFVRLWMLTQKVLSLTIFGWSKRSWSDDVLIKY